MRYAILISESDLASQNVKEKLIALYNLRKRIEENKNTLEIHHIKDCIFCNEIDKKIEADYFIFVSRHESSSKFKTLSLHFPGNWGKAILGGKDKKLCKAPASLLKNLFLNLNRIAKEEGNKEYNITLEATHHGPYLEKPCLFIEIGSSKIEWEDDFAGKIIARTLYETLTSKMEQYKTTIGIGSTHYPNNFNRLLLETEFAISHICPKYALNLLDEEMINEAIEKTEENVEFATLDWKSLGKEKRKIVNCLEKIGLKYVKVKDLLKRKN